MGNGYSLKLVQLVILIVVIKRDESALCGVININCQYLQSLLLQCGNGLINVASGCHGTADTFHDDIDVRPEIFHKLIF